MPRFLSQRHLTDTEEQKGNLIPCNAIKTFFPQSVHHVPIAFGVVFLRCNFLNSSAAHYHQPYEIGTVLRSQQTRAEKVLESKPPVSLLEL
jgi:hypothetical protein